MLSSGTQPQSGRSQKSAAKNAHARRRPIAPRERSEARRKMTHPIRRTMPTKTTGAVHSQPRPLTQA
jgi:hypothetical protein